MLLAFKCFCESPDVINGYSKYRVFTIDEALEALFPHYFIMYIVDCRKNQRFLLPSNGMEINSRSSLSLRSNYAMGQIEFFAVDSPHSNSMVPRFIEVGPKTSPCLMCTVSIYVQRVCESCCMIHVLGCQNSLQQGDIEVFLVVRA